VLSQGEASTNYNVSLGKFILNTLLCCCIRLLTLHGWTINAEFFVQVLSVNWLTHSLHSQLGLKIGKLFKKAVNSIRAWRDNQDLSRRINLICLVVFNINVLVWHLRLGITRLTWPSLFIIQGNNGVILVIQVLVVFLMPGKQCFWISWKIIIWVFHGKELLNWMDLGDWALLSLFFFNFNGLLYIQKCNSHLKHQSTFATLKAAYERLDSSLFKCFQQNIRMFDIF